jgi:ribosomal protein S18 acetylase RimI-like enzyme
MRISLGKAFRRGTRRRRSGGGEALAAKPLARRGPLGKAARMLIVQVLGPDDWKTWRELRLLALEEAAYAFGSRLADWQGDGDREERWRARLSIPGEHLVALLDGRPVGVACGVPADDARVAELISMYVHPDARGKGVGDELIRAVERWARTTGAGTLRLAVMERNAVASALYERHGFRFTGEVEEELADGRREVAMVKPLS